MTSTSATQSPSPPRPKCIVMPFQEPDGSGTGLALHFLLGNVIAVHTGFAECWFGWRAQKIFPAPDKFRAFYRKRTTDHDPTRTAAEQQIRWWVYGEISEDGRGGRITLFDASPPYGTTKRSTHLVPFSTADHLTGFREQILALLHQHGLTLPEHRRHMALWPERISMEGLTRFGRALEQFYLTSTWGDPADTDVSAFQAVTQTDPDAFMAHNLLGWAYFRRENTDMATRAFLRALELNPWSPGVMSGLMWCALKEKNRTDLAHWAAEKAAALEQDMSAARKKALARLT